MTDDIETGRAPTDAHAAGPETHRGGTPEDAAATELAVRNAVRTIGALMREDRERRRRDGLPELVLPDDLVTAQASRGPRARRGRRPAAQRRAWRPGPVHGAWAATAAAVLFWPETVLALLFGGFVICLAGTALFGPEILERLRDRAMRLVRRDERTRPARAASADDELPGPRPDRFEGLHDQRG